MNLRQTCSALIFFSLANGASADGIGVWQEELFKTLKTDAIISPSTQLVSANYVCTLAVKGQSLNVINIVEYVQGAQVPRAINKILLIDDAFKVKRLLSYASQYPLFCRGSKLFVHGDLGIDNTAPYGNTLTFDSIDDIAVTTTNPNDLPIPITSRRSTFDLK